MTVPGKVRVPGTFNVIGGPNAAGGGKGEIADGAVVDLGVLAPGEFRFLRFHADSLAGIDTPTFVHIFEDTTPPANGFSILLSRASREKVIERNLLELAGLLKRVAELDHNREATRHAERTTEAFRKPTEESFHEYLKINRTGISSITAAHLHLAKSPADIFGVTDAEKNLWKAAAEHNTDQALLALTELIERLDAQITSETRKAAKH
jgi:preprotein translocase subunit Sss1